MTLYDRQIRDGRGFRACSTLMAEGRSNVNIARTLVIADGSVEKHVRNIFTKLMLPPDLEQNPRVLAIPAYLSD